MYELYKFDTYQCMLQTVNKKRDISAYKDIKQATQIIQTANRLVSCRQITLNEGLYLYV